ncbi:hypothetical protein [Parapedobacter sp. 2B3]|uniref:hypothetical protein n=1 Tax=Parapedobacter sp. 2B3 TaxID=3342381 RepID=UPI0035B5B842
MKRKPIIYISLALVAGAWLATSCGKEELLTTLSEEAHPDRALHLDSMDVSGHWAVKTEICFIANPDDPTEQP